MKTKIYLIAFLLTALTALGHQNRLTASWGGGSQKCCCTLDCSTYCGLNGTCGQSGNYCNMSGPIGTQMNACCYYGSYPCCIMLSDPSSYQY